MSDAWYLKSTKAGVYSLTKNMTTKSRSVRNGVSNVLLDSSDPRLTFQDRR